jgi:ABC-type xylose transport system permease subunit
MSATPTDLQDERLLRPTGFGGTVGASIRRVRGGDLGSLPVVVGLVVIWAVFEVLNSAFLTPGNLSDLLVQSAATGVISVGIVLVLLLGQIDLSVGSVAGLASAILGVLLVQYHWPEWLIIPAVVLAGVVIGLVYGFLFVRFGVPSFVITLAGLLSVLGLQLFVLGPLGTINLGFTSFITEFSLLLFVPPWLTYVLAAIAAVGYGATAYLSASKRRNAGLSAPSLAWTLIKAAILLVFMVVGSAYLNTSVTGGIGDSFVLLVVLVVIMNYALTRTKWGRSVFAVGGNVEAARRAGIRVNRVYVSVFVLCSAFAAMGGLLLAGNLGSASPSTGTTDTNLNAIAAAVIGGTSLFGGRGSAYSALLGIVVIQSISNGLGLLSLDSSVRYMVTGVVLLLAVIVDSLSRRSRTAHGRA